MERNVAPVEGPSVAASDPVALTPEVKEAIAEEVKAQLAEDKAAAAPAPQAQSGSDEVPPALDPARRTFVAVSYTHLDVYKRQEVGH